MKRMFQPHKWQEVWKRIGFSAILGIAVLTSVVLTYFFLSNQQREFDTSRSAKFESSAIEDPGKYMGLYDPDKVDAELRNGHIVVIVAHYEGMSFLTGEWVRNNVAPEVRRNVVWFDYHLEWYADKNPYLFNQFLSEKNFGTVVLKGEKRLCFMTHQFREFQNEVKKLIN